MIKKLQKFPNLLLTTLLIIVILFLSQVYWKPYFNHYLGIYKYSYPALNEDFVVNTEPQELHVPIFLHKILTLAFKDRNVVVNNNRSPHLIIRSAELRSSNQSTKNAPYITISGERYSINIRRLRRNGLPIAEIVSSKPKNRKQLYFPFIIWSGVKPERIFTNSRNKFLAYVNSNCTKTREKLFKLIKERNADAEALGKCSNTKKNLPGRWQELEKVYADYNFVFAMENHQISGYITEKIINAFRSGAIPIYWGDSETVSKYFNQKAFVDVGRFSSLEDAANYIVKLNNNPYKIAQMRKEPIFNNNIKPEIFRLDENNPQSMLVDAANFIRAEYFAIVTINS